MIREKYLCLGGPNNGKWVETDRLHVDVPVWNDPSPFLGGQEVCNATMEVVRYQRHKLMDSDGKGGLKKIYVMATDDVVNGGIIKKLIEGYLNNEHSTR